MPAVAFVVDTLAGGLGPAIATGSRLLQAEGWEVSVLAPEPVQPAAITGRFIPVEIPASGRHIVAMLRAGRQIRRALAGERPDIVHCHGLRSFVLTRLVARRRSLLTLHGRLVRGAVPDDPPGYHALRRLAMAALPRLAARAFSVAPGLEPRYTFCPHASPLLTSYQQLGPFPDGAPFLWLGRLDVPKLPEELVHAAAEARGTAPAIKVDVAGDGPKAAAVAELVQRLHAPVELLGQRADVVSMLAGTRAVVLLSRAEGVPLALIEAMWAGRAVIASRLPGTEWLAGGSGNGVTIVDDRGDLVDALVRLSDAAVAAADGERAATRIRSILSPDSPWPAVERAYREVLADGSGP
jgi:glycosyltransferase involved in cell wall biosynthesis